MYRNKILIGNIFYEIFSGYERFQRKSSFLGSYDYTTVVLLILEETFSVARWFSARGDLASGGHSAVLEARPAVTPRGGPFCRNPGLRRQGRLCASCSAGSSFRQELTGPARQQSRGRDAPQNLQFLFTCGTWRGCRGPQRGDEPGVRPEPLSPRPRGAQPLARPFWRAQTLAPRRGDSGGLRAPPAGAAPGIRDSGKRQGACWEGASALPGASLLLLREEPSGEAPQTPRPPLAPWLILF